VIDLILDDCMNVMKDYKNNHFDLAIVDPPYGINIAEWDKKDDIPNELYFKELFRISKNQIIFGGNYFSLPHTQSWICWDKTFNDDIRGKKLTKGGCPRENMSDFELLWTSFNHKAKMFRFTQIGNLVGFDDRIKVDYKRQKKIHPTQKDVKLYEWLLHKYAEKGQKILDTHLGSGSIAIACHYFGVDLVGVEIDKEYYNKAKERVDMLTRQEVLF